MQITSFGFRSALARLGLCLSPVAAALLLVAKPTQAQNSATLGIQPVATNQVQLSWQPVTGFEQVQRANKLGPTNNWQFVTNSPLLQSPLMLLRQNITNSQGFFRLANGSQPATAPINLPDPSTIVPVPPPNTQLSFGDVTSFLYSGPNPVQLGTAPGAITPAQAAVLRGRVLTASGSPLNGVHVFIPSHPEYGYTYTRTNGLFDLAVNGGGQVTVDFQLAGYCPAQRQMFVLNQGFGHVPDVTLKNLDPVANPITFGSNSPAQWIVSSAQTDTNGARTAKVYVPPGTLAVMDFADGTTQAVSGLTIRVTEFTVGSNGPSAMPAPLPPSSAYSYCADFTADEALAAGAQLVSFSQPLYSYLTNYLGIPVGLLVPNGYYDRSLGAWVPVNNGQIIQIVGVSNGLAEISFNTNGTVADAGTLATNQFTTNELVELAGAFPIGASLTRVAMNHFCAQDRNFAPVPGNPANPQTPANQPKPPGNQSNKNYGTLRTAEQVFEESIPLAGVPFSLNYSSARVPDYRANGQVSFPLLIPSSQPVAEYPNGVVVWLADVKMDVDLAGVTNEIVVPTTNDSFIANINVPWDKSWAYGTNLPGAASTVAQISLDYHYVNDGNLVEAEEFAAAEFRGGATSQTLYQERSLFEQFGSLTSEAVHDASDDVDELTSFTETVTIPDHRVLGLGGWSLGPQHYYDPAGQILYLGDGTIRKSPPLADSLTVATDFANRQILSISPLSDGSCYLMLGAVGGQPGQIVRYFPNQAFQAITGGPGSPNFDGNGGVINASPNVSANGYPAANAAFGSQNPEIELATGPDDTVYFCYDQSSIWHIDKQGLLRPVVQGGPYGVFQPDGTYGTNASIAQVNGNVPHVSVGLDGSVYYCESPNTIQTTNAAWNGAYWGLIRRVGTDGRIYTIAGQGGPYPGNVDLGFGQPAAAAQLHPPLGLCAARDGSIYWMSSGDTAQTPFINRITPSGMMEAVANYPQSYAVSFPISIQTPFDDDGVPLASVPASRSGGSIGPEMSQGLDGSLYFSTMSGFIGVQTEFIWQVSPDGYIHRAAGMFYGSSEGIARDVYLGSSAAVQTKVGSDGTLYAAVARSATFSQSPPFDYQLLKMSTRTPTLAAGDIAITSDDGSEFYIFDQGGHHLLTLNTLTGTTNWLFSYDTNNLVVTMQDANGLVTTIQRDSAGRPEAIIGPYGQATKLSLDANGFLASVTDPAGNVTSLGNSTGGLLQSITGPRGFTYTASYDALGRSLGATDPSGGSDQLGLQQISQFADSTDSQVLTYWVISDTNSLGATSSSSSILLGDNTTLTQTTSPMGVTNWEADAIDGDVTLTNADGCVLLEKFVSDPRFPSQTHLVSRATLNLPGGLSWQEIASYAITTNSQTSLAMGGWTNLFSVNGNTYTDTYNGSNQIEMITSPEGRQLVTQSDSQGHVILEHSPGLADVTISYDADGRFSTLSETAGTDTRTTTMGYDVFGRLSLLTDSLGQTNAFNYDLAGRLQQLTLADGRLVGFQNDGEGNITNVIPPGRPAHQFGFNAVGLLSSYTPPMVNGLNDTVTYAYTTERQLNQASFPDGQNMLIKWNADGNITDLSLGSGPALAYEYNTNSGQLTSIVSTTGDVLSFAYQGFLLTSMAWSGVITGQVGEQFTADLLPAIQTVNSTDPIFYGYNGDLLLTNVGPLALARNTNGLIIATALGGLQDQRQFDELGHLTNYTVIANGSNLWTTALSYDAIGRITNKMETINGTSRAFAYAYDTAGRLSQVWLNGTISATYGYDTNGNRLTRNGETATYDEQDRVQTYANSTFGWSPNGNLLTAATGGQVTTYAYDVRGALTSVALPGGPQIQYVIDAVSRRIGKLADGVLQRGWLWDGMTPVAEVDSNSTVTLRFIYAADGNTPSLLFKGTNTYRIFSDERDSVRLVVNLGDGSIAQQLDYDEFGRVLTDTAPGFQPFGFAGGLYDPDTALVRFGARDYSAQTGQWNARDPLLFQGGSLTLYAYLDNDPVNHTDVGGTGPSNLKLPSIFGGNLRTRNADINAIIDLSQKGNDNQLRNTLNNADGTVRDVLRVTGKLAQKGAEVAYDAPFIASGIAAEGIVHEAVVTAVKEGAKGASDELDEALERNAKAKEDAEQSKAAWEKWLAAHPAYVAAHPGN
jgi:RHS repeat-associated protein